MLEYKEIRNDDWSDYFGQLDQQIVEIMKLNEYKSTLDESKGQIIFYGPPGTGKTHVAKKLANLITKYPLDDWSITDNRKLVQFHPSYSYEDFVQGIKPKKTADGIDYEIRPGIFQKLCQISPMTEGQPIVDPTTGSNLEKITWKECAIFILLKEGQPLDFNIIHERTMNGHEDGGYGGLKTTNSETAEKNQRWQLNEDQRANKEKSIFIHTIGESIWDLNTTSPEYKKYENMFSSVTSISPDNSPKVLIIDEINRGNLPKIFGELIYALEYRDEPIELQYKEFDEDSEYGTLVVPKNLSIIGSMNTADRSIVLFDTALRRRFSFIPLFPDYDLLSQIFGIDSIFDKVKFDTKLRDSSEELEKYKIISIMALAKINSTLIEEPSIGREKQIGHTFLLSLKNNKNQFTKIWGFDIIPLLEEFYFEDTSEINEMFDDNIFTETNGIRKFTDKQLFDALDNYVHKD